MQILAQISLKGASIIQIRICLINSQIIIKMVNKLILNIKINLAIKCLPGMISSTQTKTPNQFLKGQGDQTTPSVTISSRGKMTPSDRKSTTLTTTKYRSKASIASPLSYHRPHHRGNFSHPLNSSMILHSKCKCRYTTST